MQMRNICNFNLPFHQSLNPARPTEPGSGMRALSVFPDTDNFKVWSVVTCTLINGRPESVPSLHEETLLGKFR